MGMPVLPGDGRSVLGGGMRRESEDEAYDRLRDEGKLDYLYPVTKQDCEALDRPSEAVIARNQLEVINQ